MDKIPTGVTRKAECPGKAWAFEKRMGNRNSCYETCRISYIGHILGSFKSVRNGNRLAPNGEIDGLTRNGHAEFRKFGLFADNFLLNLTGTSPYRGLAFLTGAIRGIPNNTPKVTPSGARSF